MHLCLVLAVLVTPCLSVMRSAEGTKHQLEQWAPNLCVSCVNVLREIDFSGRK